MNSSISDTSQPEASVTSKSLPERQGYADRVHCRVAVVGLGHLGQAFAVNLITDGHQVFAYDRNPERMKPLRGAYVAAPLADLAPCDVVISSLTDDDALTAVALGTEGLVSVLAVGAVHISMSTVSPTLSQRLAEEHALLGQDYVAAPVLLTGNASVAGCQGSAARSGGSRTLCCPNACCKPCPRSTCGDGGPRVAGLDWSACGPRRGPRRYSNRRRSDHSTLSTDPDRTRHPRRQAQSDDPIEAATPSVRYRPHAQRGAAGCRAFRLGIAAAGTPRTRCRRA
jgi:NAD binding domain of 6-phosphogluconate dehydrogenase